MDKSLLRSVHRDAPTKRTWLYMILQCLCGLHYYVDYYDGRYRDDKYLYTRCETCHKKGVIDIAYFG